MLNNGREFCSLSPVNTLSVLTMGVSKDMNPSDKT